VERRPDLNVIFCSGANFLDKAGGNTSSTKNNHKKNLLDKPISGIASLISGFCANNAGIVRLDFESILRPVYIAVRDYPRAHVVTQMV
jgi:hypothetical protein